MTCENIFNVPNGSPDVEILHWVESDILFLQELSSETLHDPILSKIVERIRNICSNCTKSERHHKEIIYKLSMENLVAENGDLIVPSNQ